MGFPNVDIFLVTKLLARFKELQHDPAFILNELFSDFDDGQRIEVAKYISRKQFTTDLRDRKGEEVFIFPHFPQVDKPLPQIAISLGNENPAERFIGDVAGESVPIYVGNEIVAWGIPKGYIGAATYYVDVACALKDEAIWLSRLVQRFICEEQQNLANIGAYEADPSLADMKIDPEMFPHTVFNRRVTLTCKVENTWSVRVPVAQYKTGVNTAIQEIP